MGRVVPSLSAEASLYSGGSPGAFALLSRVLVWWRRFHSLHRSTGRVCRTVPVDSLANAAASCQQRLPCRAESFLAARHGTTRLYEALAISHGSTKHRAG